MQKPSQTKKKSPCKTSENSGHKSMAKSQNPMGVLFRLSSALLPTPLSQCSVCCCSAAASPSAAPPCVQGCPVTHSQTLPRWAMPLAFPHVLSCLPAPGTQTSASTGLCGAHPRQDAVGETQVMQRGLGLSQCPTNTSPRKPVGSARAAPAHRAQLHPRLQTRGQGGNKSLAQTTSPGRPGES